MKSTRAGSSRRSRAPPASATTARAGAKREAEHADAPGNQATQRMLARHGVRAKLALSHATDAAEVEADALAPRLVSPTVERVAPTAAHGGGASGVARKASRRGTAKAHDAAAAAAASVQSGGAPLAPAERAEFEARLGTDLGGVRIHTHDSGARAAADIGARAFTHGRDIAFARGEFQPHDPRGRSLLAHELVHVAQSGTAGVVIQRDENDSSGAPVCQADTANDICAADEGPQVCEADPAADAAPSLGLQGDTDERIDGFKELVKTTAIHRLVVNQRNLGQWAGLVDHVIPESSLAAVGLSQSGGFRAYAEMQDERSPGVRWLRGQQAIGRYRECTGCHIEKDMRAQESDMPHIGRQWLSPNQARAGAPTPGEDLFVHDQDGNSPFHFPIMPPRNLGYTPPAGTTEGMLNTLLPDPSAVQDLMKKVQPILDTLGPNGYAVLPNSMLGELDMESVASLRAEIIAAIEQRKKDFQQLIGKIQSGDVGYEHFGPIIRDLLPAADDEVRAAIQDEMDSNAFWSKVEAVVVGILTVAALILTIFPPTSALGLALVATLDIGLATYGAGKGMEMMDTGETYGLARGADDVVSRENQDAASTMVLMGFVSVVTAPLAIAGGASKLATATAKLETAAQSATALARVGETIQRGDFVLTIAQDGSITATSISKPDLMIILRDNTATLYQSLGPGGVRVLGSMEVDIAAVTADAGMPFSGFPDAASTPVLTAGDNASTPLMLTAGDNPSTPLMLTAGDNASAPLMLTAGDDAPMLLLTAGDDPAMPLMVSAGEDAAGGLRALPPGPEPPKLLGPGNPTTYTWDQISKMRQPRLWQEREIYMQQLYGSSGQQHFPVPGTGGRFVDAPAPGGAGFTFAGEAKSYTRWITVEGQAQRNVVDLSERIESQIAKDVWLRDNVPGFDPRWMFTDAPPTAALRQALRDAGIAFIEY